MLCDDDFEIDKVVDDESGLTDMESTEWERVGVSGNFRSYSPHLEGGFSKEEYSEI